MKVFENEKSLWWKKKHLSPFQQHIAIQLRIQAASFTLDWAKNDHTNVWMSKEIHKDAVWWTLDIHTATAPPPDISLPSGFRRFTARLQRRRLSVISTSGESETSLLDILIHTNSRLIVVVASECVCSFDAERRVHLLLILDRLTSASLFTPSRALSARFVDAPGRSERAFRFRQQVDVGAASGGTF